LIIIGLNDSPAVKEHARGKKGPDRAEALTQYFAHNEPRLILSYGGIFFLGIADQINNIEPAESYKAACIEIKRGNSFKEEEL
jgi:hypothetical protein